MTITYAVIGVYGFILGVLNICILLFGLYDLQQIDALYRKVSKITLPIYFGALALSIIFDTFDINAVFLGLFLGGFAWWLQWP